MRNKIISSFKGKGYYIALILCAAAIGISGYLYYRNTNQPADDPDTQVSVNTPVLDPDVQTSATTAEDKTNPTTGTTPGNTPAAKKITRPVSGDTIVGYAMEVLQYNETTRDWRVHNGIDIAAQAGTQVYAAADGTVYTVFQDDTMGYTVVIRHDDGYVTKYSSLSEDVAVTAGETVRSGQVIGQVGNTALLETAVGDHLHFSVTCNGEAVNPQDFLSQG